MRLRSFRQRCHRDALVLVVAITSSGCVAHGYYPALARAPLLQARGDMEVVVHPDTVGVQASVARALTDHLEAHAAGDAKFGNVSTDAGVGLFTTMWGDGNGGLRLAASGDVGMGRVRQSKYVTDADLLAATDGSGGSDDWHFSGDFRRFSGQVETGLVSRAGSGLLLVFRVTSVEGEFGWSHVHTPGSGDPYGIGYTEGSIEHRSFVFTEPVLVGRLALDQHLALEIQAGEVGTSGSSDDFLKEGLRREIVAAGLVARF